VNTRPIGTTFADSLGKLTVRAVRSLCPRTD